MGLGGVKKSERCVNSLGGGRRGRTFLAQTAGLAQDAPDAGGTGGYQIGGHHHFGEAPVADAGVQGLESEDALLFALFEPKIPGYVAVVLVLGAVAFAPVVELADGEAGGCEERFDGAVGPFGPVGDEVDDLVARFGLDPAPVERAPNSFFEGDVLGEEFGDELVFLAERVFQFVDAFLCFVAGGSFLVLVDSGLGDQRRAAVGEELLLPGVEPGGRQVGILADLGYGLLFDEMEPQESEFVVRGPLLFFL